MYYWSLNIKQKYTFNPKGFQIYNYLYELKNFLLAFTMK